MKIHILFRFRDGAWGGGNQFLKALRAAFQNQNAYIDDIEKADVILFSSYPFGSERYFDRIISVKQRFPQKIVIYRVDGPISRSRGSGRIIDEFIALFSNLITDGVIFQSHWCKKQNIMDFNIESKYETVIHNAPDEAIFNTVDRVHFHPAGKIKLVAVSWSSNWRKGFDIYRYLDENLDFSRFRMSFVGNSPTSFKNIEWIHPLDSHGVARILKQHDIYVTASQDDPCSNSLVEAFACGLPVVALNGGGHPELLQEGGELFHGKNDVIGKIEALVKNYRYYQSKIPKRTIADAAREYYEFAGNIFNDMKQAKYVPKKTNLHRMTKFLQMRLRILRWKFLDIFLGPERK